MARTIGETARTRWKSSGLAVLVFVRTIDDVKTVREALTDRKEGVPADQVQVLTGTLRGLERDQLASSDPVFARFMPEPKVPPKQGSVYLVCTSAGEVGVDISANHMVSDLTSLDSMAQRLGRVNRRGSGAAKIDVVYETDPDPEKKDDPFDKARWETLGRLRELPSCRWIADRHEASPHEIGQLIGRLTQEQLIAAFAPTPIILPTSDILFDAWAMTTIRGKLPGRPMVEPYLHGISGWEPPETHVAWREEVERLQPKFKSDEERKEREADDRKSLAKLAVELLDDYPLKPHELLQEPSYRAFKQFEAIAKRCSDAPVWLVDDDDKVEVLILKDLADKDEKERIEGKTVLLPPSAGGLKAGMLDGTTAAPANDVADELFADDERSQPLRVRVNDPMDKRAKNMRLIRRIDSSSPDDDEDAEGKSWYWFGIDNSGEKTAKLPVLWQVHVDDVIGHSRTIVANLPLDQNLKDAIIVAAQLHDHGKKRRQFQIVLNNRRFPAVVLAKSGKKSGRFPETYRHEFGALLELANQSEFVAIADQDMKELVLHLIATHHGRARPHFPQDEAFDPEPPAGSNATDMAMSVPRRFARLQRKYGHWGLAYLESLLRAADWAASGSPSAFCKEEE